MPMKNYFIFSLFVAFAILGCTNANAQNKAKVTIGGQVFSISEFEGNADKTTVPFAVVILPESNVSVSSDADGIFSIQNLAQGTHKIQIQSLGYETLDTVINVSANRTRFEFTLVESNFRMQELVVTAQSSKAGAATSSFISKTAMEHMQTNSLADVMALTPGGSVTKPDLQKVSSASIRGGSSLGTAVVMDGSPLSNNANMQTLSSAISTENKTRSLTPETGVDLRTITTDNVESIEVIRGVAPVEYGDITSGAIIVNSKAGKQPLTLKLAINPNLYSISATQGFALGKKAGNINYGIDYAYSVSDPVESYDYYQRITARVGYTNTFGKFYTNSSLSFLWTKDMSEPNEDDPNDFQTFNQKDVGFRIAHNGTYNANAGWFKSLQYNLSFGYTNRKSYFQDQATSADFQYSYSKIDGSVVSSYKNGHVYDVEGNRLTRYEQEMEQMRAWMLPGTYDYNYNIYGKELNTFAKVKANFAGNWGSTNHKLVLGADFKSDGNVGDGKVFDIDNPPFRASSASFTAYRERAFKDIPFVNQLGAFLQETFSAKIANREFEIVAGVRYDHTLDFGGGFSPRINMSYELVPEKLNLHAAYGITRKAPTLMYLYPDNAYFDLLNFNNASASDIADSQKMQLVTTRVFDATNHNLEMARQDKYEIGLTANLGKMHFSLVGYQEEMLNGYSFSITPETVKSITYKQYKAAEYPSDGSAPILQETASNQVLVKYYTPDNNSAYKRTGLEFVLDFGRINAIRTSFLIDGQIYTQKSWNKGYYTYNYLPSGASSDYSQYPDLGVFIHKETQGLSYLENFATNFIITHNIPQIGLVITATAHVNWRTKAWTNYAEDDLIPAYYIERETGQMKPFDKAWANPEHEMYNTMKYLLRDTDSKANPIRKLHNRVYDPNLIVNLNVTKQFGDNFDVAFFVQNMFRSSPLQRVLNEPGMYERMNPDLFFFGLQLNARIK